jgi:HEAT repeat protein
MDAMPRTALRPALVLLLAFASMGPAVQEEDLVSKLLKSADVKERLDAVRKLSEGDHVDAETLLIVATDDKDWEVAIRACEGLAKKATEKSVRPLAVLCLEAPVRGLRIAAAGALGARQPEAGTKLVQTALGAKDDFTAACAAEALAEIRHSSAKERLRGALQEKSSFLRREAAQALGSLGDPGVLPDLEKLLRDPDLRARAGAVEGIARTGDIRAVAMLLSELQDKLVTDLVERRVVSAIRRLVWKHRGTEEADAAVRKVVSALVSEKDGPSAARICRVLGSLCRAGPQGGGAAGGVPVASGGDADGATPGDGAAGTPPAADPAAADAKPPAPAPKSGPGLLEGEGPIGDRDMVIKALADSGLGHKEAVARRAAAGALTRIGGADSLAHLKTAAGGDTDDLVRFHALRGWRKWRTAKNEEAFQLFANVLRYDKSALVREEAAVGLGVKGLAGAVDTLAAATKDAAWEVAVASAVSLGKTRDPRSAEALTPMLASKDWRLRGAGAAGLGWSYRVEAIPVLIPVLSDPEPSVSRTAWEFLKRLTDKDLPLKQKEWEAFWAEKGKGYTLVDREAEIREARKYGYAVRDKDVYENLDVVVLKSRGDTIQNLLSVLEIKHRMTQSASVKRDGVQPFGVFVSNCTGEIQPDDHERVQWFVHAGGALFASCWAIDKTVGEEFPLTMRKYPKAMGQVLDQVRAEELPTDSEYISGVFPGFTRPIYELYGAFLIEVLDPERLEVLIDSPDCATRWGGCGNLAAWFTSGHGVVLGSSNHFDRQTISKLQGAWGVSVKTEADRRAFAIDHFGFNWERVRELDKRGVFGKQSEAEKEVTDLSAFRLLSNFVRRKRIVDL